MTDLVCNKVNQILKQEGLEDLLQMDPDPIKIMERDHKDTLNYKSALNQDDHYLRLYILNGGNLEAPINPSKIQYNFTFSKYWNNQLGGINFSTDNFGKLISDANIDSQTLMGHYFSKLNTKKGANFAPIFQKMAQVYRIYFHRDSTVPSH